MSSQERQQSIIGISIALAVLIILFLVELYFVCVVIRARKFLVEERNIQKSVAYYGSYPGGQWVEQQPHYYHGYHYGGGRRNVPTYVYY
jgi:hypothetical protein